MMDFKQWAETNKKSLDFLQDQEVQQGPEANEDSARTGLGLYPPGYKTSQYPDNYFTPIKSTALLDLKNQKELVKVSGGKSNKSSQ